MQLPSALRIASSALCVILICVYPAVPTLAAAELTRAQYEDCAARNEDGLNAVLTDISANALKDGMARADTAALVRDAWRRNNLDDIVDKRVDIAIEEVKSETSWGELIKSLANTETSQKLATEVAERVYRSEAVKAAFEVLAGDVAKDIGKTMEAASTEASAPVLSCLKAFIGPRYGMAIADAVAGDAGKNLSIDPEKGSGDADATAILKQSGGGIAGVTILIVRRQLATLATRIGQRLAGSVLSRLVSVAAGGIGLVLIAKDIWEFRNGVLPIIATEMKSKDTKAKVQLEIANSVAEQVGDHVKEIAAASAAHIAGIWKEFKRAHAIVLRLAEADTKFRDFLESVEPAKLARLDEVTGLVVAAEGEAGVKLRLENGSLNEAVHIMPDAAMTIARETRSVVTALAWNAIAGSDIAAVVEYDIHRRASPENFTRKALARVLSLKDRTAVMRVAALPVMAREALFSLEAGDLNVLARNLSESELTTLASYLDGLLPIPRERVLRAVAESPGKMRILARDRVRDAIIASADQEQAVAMMLESQAAFSPRTFARDLALAIEGRVTPTLIWDRHPGGTAGLGILFLLLVLWLGRLFRRPGASPPASPSGAS